MRAAIALCVTLCVTACQSGSETPADRTDTGSTDGAGAPGTDDPNGASTAGDGGPPGADDVSAVDRVRADTTWPEKGPIDYRRVRSVDFTGDGEAEQIFATARGPAYDSLEVGMTITAPPGDTLWHEAWPSLLYFKYDPIEGKADTTVRAMVRDHVEQLLARDRFTMAGGLPAALSRGGDPEATMREALHYHLAELDWRRNAGLSPAAAMPLEAYSEISTDNVTSARVSAVLDDVRDAPSFMYYAGGEATYAIVWSQLEQAFVRIYACC